MKTRTLAQALMAGALIVGLSAPAFVSAQEQFFVARERAKGQVAPPGWKAPKLSTGAPDLQGNWSNATLTPLQRTTQFKGLVLTEQEAGKLEGTNDAYLAERNKPTDPKLTIQDLPVDCGRGFSGTSCGYDNAWTDPGETVMRVKGQPRSSFLTTADGRIPARKTGATAPAGRGGLPQGVRQNDNPEGRSLGERCIMSFGSSSGPIMQPQLYNNTYKIVQGKDAVAILVEMVHDVRVVRLNSKHRNDGVRPLMGDSIGRYEGDTLVVETINFPQRQAVSGSWENLKVTERFTRAAPGRLHYAFTIEDNTLWDAPWGGEYEFNATGDVYEYACHEGNYGLQNILAGARDEDRQAARGAGARAGTQ